MILIIAISVAAAIAALMTAAYFAWTIAANPGDSGGAEWLGDWSQDRYRPMFRLLDKEDFLFLRTQPGYSPEMENTLRRQRVYIFRCYLNNLETDFAYLCSALKQDSAPSDLMRRQLRFVSNMLSLRVRLALYERGLCEADPAQVLAIFDSLRLRVRSSLRSGSRQAARSAPEFTSSASASRAGSQT